jgi:endonuclease YncB( thermonuclease family)
MVAALAPHAVREGVDINVAEYLNQVIRPIDVAALAVAARHADQLQALDWPRYSKGMFAREQEQARAARSGMWQGTFQPPWHWRQQ